MGLVKFLKFPLWLLKLFVKKRKKVGNELEQKQRKYVHNFSVRNISWQKSLGKGKKKKKRHKSLSKRTKKVACCVANKKTSQNLGY